MVKLLEVSEESDSGEAMLHCTIGRIIEAGAREGKHYLLQCTNLGAIT
jgi:hypothetical protein